MCATKKTKHNDKMQNSGWYGISLGWSASLRRAYENKENKRKIRSNKDVGRGKSEYHDINWESGDKHGGSCL
jgi:hypothetical protein